MSGTIAVTIRPTAWLLGVRGIDIVVDGKVAATTGFGETREIACPAGDHVVEIVLRAIVGRRSNRLPVTVADGGKVAVEAVYSRIWGRLRVRPA